MTKFKIQNKSKTQNPNIKIKVFSFDIRHLGLF